MEDWLNHYHSFSPEEKKEVSDFVSFIASRKQQKSKDFKQDLKKWKKNLLKISVWSSKDIAVFKENEKYWKWKAQEW